MARKRRVNLKMRNAGSVLHAAAAAAAVEVQMLNLKITEVKEVVSEVSDLVGQLADNFLRHLGNDL